MIIIISAQQPQLTSSVDKRFGRSPTLVKMDTDTGKWEALTNPGVSQSSGAGVAAAQLVIDQKANAVISGDFGPHAANAFRAASINMHLFIADASTVQDAIDQYQLGKLPVFD